MKAQRRFTVRPRVPEALSPLEILAGNLRWSWDRRTRDLFADLDPQAWDDSRHDPRGVLARTSPERLEELAADPAYLERVAEAAAGLNRYLTAPRWFQEQGNDPVMAEGVVAYFSPEFGIAEAVPQYSGGLGILAGDHLKAASDLGVPLVGIGLFYRHGYFRQALTVDGWQQESFPNLDPYAMALELCEGALVEVDLADEVLRARVWRAQVGRTPLYLLDADIDANPDHLRLVTDRLYGGDTEHRLRQEILLGIGGVRALDALGINVTVFHTNEGHAGFLGLERIRVLMERRGLSYREALAATRAGSVFTTHTPVPAGIDRFPRDLIERHFGRWAAACGVSLDELIGLGHRPGDDRDERFNMAVMGMRLAERRNGVAALHGEVSREMFADLWPGVPTEEAPVGSVTNGVHGHTWVSAEMDEVLTKAVGADWFSAGPDAWRSVLQVSDGQLAHVRKRGRERLVELVRNRLHTGLRQRGRTESELGWISDTLDPNVLTVCFARRFATYKRATLLLSQPERLRALLCDAERPLQLVFAGKAHPADDLGKELIRQVVAASTDPALRHRFVFVEDYDIAVARALLQGGDVWLNTPLRPMEACGTSGMKAVLNGGIHCSTLDGWWHEMFDAEPGIADDDGLPALPPNGWAIASVEIEDHARRDELEANSLFDLLEQQIVPLFYEGGRPGPAWFDRIRCSLATLGPQVSAHRMVRDYVEHLYLPAARHVGALAADDHAGARAFAAWLDHLHDRWHAVHVDAVEADERIGDLHERRAVTATVSLGGLTPADVTVQLVIGSVGQTGELESPVVLPMSPVEGAPEGHHCFRADAPLDRSGRMGVTVRIVPHHPQLAVSVEPGLVAWA